MKAGFKQERNNPFRGPKICTDIWHGNTVIEGNHRLFLNLYEAILRNMDVPLTEESSLV